ncbi:MAG: hypothetical protein K8H86_07565, partial [Ignavibacteriaceae bacterium]|nr:hypothetical protein [Ignavibacteriaceae bacterium]
MMEVLASLHAKIIHFPIAFLMLYILLEFLGVTFKRDFFSKAAHLLLLLAVITALFAVFTGSQAKALAQKWGAGGAVIPLNAIGEHEQYATIILWYFAVLLVVRSYLVFKKKFSGVFKYGVLILAFIGGYLLYETSEYGGKLVYKYGLGT